MAFALPEFGPETLFQPKLYASKWLELWPEAAQVSIGGTSFIIYTLLIMATITISLYDGISIISTGQFSGNKQP